MKQSNSWLSGLWRAADMASRSASPASADDERHAVVSNPPSPTQLTGLVAAEAKSHRRQHSDQSRFARPAKKNVRRARVVEPETDEEYTASEDWRRDCRAVAVLGQGSFGRVHLVTFQGGKFALKSVAVASLTTPKKREHARSERVALALLRGHPNILRMHAAWTAPGALHLATECAWGGELFRHLQRRKRFAAAETRFIIAELAAALCHAHKHKVAYRDVKPENVLFGGTGHVLLADFGLSKIVSIDEKDFPTKGCISLCGTPEYMAPEVLDRAPYGGSVDWCVLRVLMYTFVYIYTYFYVFNVARRRRSAHGYAHLTPSTMYAYVYIHINLLYSQVGARHVICRVTYGPAALVHGGPRRVIS